MKMFTNTCKSICICIYIWGDGYNGQGHNLFYTMQVLRGPDLSCTPTFVFGLKDYMRADYGRLTWLSTTY